MAFLGHYHLTGDLSRQVVVALKVMSKMDISENRRPQDGDWENIRLVNTQGTGNGHASQYLPCVNGEKL